MEMMLALVAIVLSFACGYLAGGIRHMKRMMK